MEWVTMEGAAIACSVIFSAGGFYHVMKHKAEQNDRTDSEQQETIAEINKRVSRLETKQDVQEAFISQIGNTIAEQKDNSKELARCIRTLETTVSRLSAIVENLLTK